MLRASGPDFAAACPVARTVLKLVILSRSIKQYCIDLRWVASQIWRCRSQRNARELSSNGGWHLQDGGSIARCQNSNMMMFATVSGGSCMQMAWRVEWRSVGIWLELNIHQGIMHRTTWQSMLPMANSVWEKRQASPLILYVSEDAHVQLWIKHICKATFKVIKWQDSTFQWAQFSRSLIVMMRKTLCFSEGLQM